MVGGRFRKLRPRDETVLLALSSDECQTTPR
jgi:hypothetical protein